jgi:two-component system, NtrC family, sensor histidine kinase HydH
VNRRILLQVAGPAVGVGLLLLVVCLVSAWQINRLQANMAHLLQRDVAGLEAAQELEIQLRRLRFHSFIYLLDPVPARQEPIDDSEREFQSALQRAKASAAGDDDRALLQAIEESYHRYRDEMASLRTSAESTGPQRDVRLLADQHPLHPAAKPCEELVKAKREAMARSAQESERVSDRLSLTLLLLGLGGPAGGLLSGYGIARGLARSFQRSEQLAAVGQLAAGVAHEVRNPLTSIKMLIEAALRRPEGQGLTREDLEVMHAEVKRLEGTVQGFLDFARPPRLQRAPCDLRAVVAQSVELVAARARQQGVTVDVRQPEAALMADVDRGQICTVLVNLFLNGLDAMPRGGRLEVCAEANADGAVLRIADTGSGIAPTVAARLFTPFVSTKATGTGLGLSISRRILEEHGGAIRAGNRPEGGAVFTIILPRKSSLKSEI